jgi:glucuronate isomerase
MRAPVDPAAVAAFLNGLESTHNVFSRKEDSARAARLNNPVQNSLPRTILLSLNPEAHASLAVLAGSFSGAGLPGKVQLGPAWWWCDHEEGIRDVLEKNAAYGVLSTFIGMTTDSRSLLSFVRHDYFRRILCKWVAEKIGKGAFPDDESLLRPMLENICNKNARRIFSRLVNPVNPVNPV